MPNPVLPKSYIFDLDHKEFVIRITADKHLQLFVDGCLRKYDDSADPVLMYGPMLNYFGKNIDTWRLDTTEPPIDCGSP